MSTKSESQWIQFLLICIDCCDGKVNYEEVAKRTGWYKAGKFSKQALDNLKKKYPFGKEEVASANGGNKARAGNKRKTEEGMGNEAKQSKKSKKIKTEGDAGRSKSEDEDVDGVDAGKEA